MRRLYSPSLIARKNAIYESHELYEDICFYLVNEGYSDTLEGAQIIASNLSEGVLKHLKRIVKGNRDALRRRRAEIAAIERQPHPTDFNRSVRPTGDNEFRESYDAYDIVVSHLLDKGYTNSIEDAEVIAMNMSEGWISFILEDFQDLSPEKEQRVKERLGQLAREVQVLGATHKELGKKPLARFRPGIKNRRSQIAKTAKRKGKLAQNAADALIRTSTSKSANIEFQRQQLLRRMRGEEDSD